MEKFAIKIDDAVKASLYKICRLCGIDNPKKVPIIDPTNRILDVDEPGLCQKIKILIKVIVTENDKMPQTICFGCRDKINDFYEFRELCFATEVQTRNLLGLDPIKTEQIFDGKSEALDISGEVSVTANCSLKRGRKRKSDELLLDNKNKASATASLIKLKTEFFNSELNNNNDKKKKRVSDSRATKDIKKETSVSAASVRITRKYLKTCTICSKRFNDKKSLDKHKREVHVPKVDRYFCIACDLSLNTPAEIKAHQTKHKNLKMPFVCGLCDESIPNLFAYTKHMSGHNQNVSIDFRVYNRECPKCRIKYTTNYLYNTHNCSIETKRCGGCGDDIFGDKLKYIRHASHCSLAYLLHSKYISGEVEEVESDVKIKNEAAELERDVADADGVAIEWPVPQKKSAKRDLAKDFQIRADKLLKSTMDTLGIIKTEPEIRAGLADEIGYENEEKTCSQNDFDVDNDHFNDNNDSEEDDAPTDATFDCNVDIQVLNNNKAAEDMTDRIDFAVKEELLGIVPPLKLKITNKEGLLNSSFSSTFDDSSSIRHEKKKRKKKHRDEKRQKISYEVNHNPSSSSLAPAVLIKLEKDNYDDDDGRDNDNGNNNAVTVDGKSILNSMLDNNYLNTPPPIMTAIPMSQIAVSSMNKSFTNSSDISDFADAPSMAVSYPPMLMKPIVDDENPRFSSINHCSIKQEPIDELMDDNEDVATVTQIKQEAFDDYDDIGREETQAVTDEIQIPCIKNESTVKLTARKSTGGLKNLEQLQIRVKQEFPFTDSAEQQLPNEIQTSSDVSEQSTSMMINNISCKSQKARKSTGGLPQIEIGDILVKQEMFDKEATQDVCLGAPQMSSVQSTEKSMNIRVKKEFAATDNDQEPRNEILMPSPIFDQCTSSTINKNPFIRPTARMTGRKSTGGINRFIPIDFTKYLNLQIKQEPVEIDPAENRNQAMTVHSPTQQNILSEEGLDTARTSTKPNVFTNPYAYRKGGNTSNIAKKSTGGVPQILSMLIPTNVVIKEEPTERAEEPAFVFNNIAIKQEYSEETTSVLEHNEIQENSSFVAIDGMAAEEAEEAKEDVQCSDNFYVNRSSDMYINNEQSSTSLGLVITNVQGQAAVSALGEEYGGDDNLPLAATKTTSSETANASCSESARSTYYDELATFSGNLVCKKDMELQAQPVLDDTPSTSSTLSPSSSSSATLASATAAALASATIMIMPNNMNNEEEEQQNVLNHELLAQNTYANQHNADAVGVAPSSSTISHGAASISNQTTTTTLAVDAAMVQNEETENQINEQQMQQQDEQQQQQHPQLMQQQQAQQLVYDCNNINEIAENNNNANIERELNTSQHQQEQRHQNENETEANNEGVDSTNNSGAID